MQIYTHRGVATRTGGDFAPVGAVLLFAAIAPCGFGFPPKTGLSTAPTNDQ
jgi:hypothetical protein